MSKELDMARELVKTLEAKEGVVKQAAQADVLVELGSLNPGDVFKIGEHDFIVLEQVQNSSDDAGVTKVISKEFMAESEKFGESRDYAESNLRRVIEGDIEQYIEDAIGADNLVVHEVDLTSVDMQRDLGTIKCKVRPITFDEARKYNDLLVAPEIGDWWWTCTPWSAEERGQKYSVAVVSPSGCIGNGFYVGRRGVRPFCILKSNIFVSKGEK